ncbi:MAG: hypothetical protein Ct9H300mP28_37270 [Pseudomonadota bacterium]|nr:MAG: hypothetical protein Ct9H300mP28_37270 [Pseudomonadota bacterium]
MRPSRGRNRQTLEKPHKTNIPLCHSIAASSSLEVTLDRARVNAGSSFMWARRWKEHGKCQASQDAGFEVLILTVDVPQVASVT